MRQDNVASRLFARDWIACAYITSTRKQGSILYGKPTPTNWEKNKGDASREITIKSASIGYIMRDSNTNIMMAKGT